MPVCSLKHAFIDFLDVQDSAPVAWDKAVRAIVKKWTKQKAQKPPEMGPSQGVSTTSGRVVGQQGDRPPFLDRTDGTASSRTSLDQEQHRQMLHAVPKSGRASLSRGNDASLDIFISHHVEPWSSIWACNAQIAKHLFGFRAREVLQICESRSGYFWL